MVFGGPPVELVEPEWVANVMLNHEQMFFLFMKRFSVVFWQTRPILIRFRSCFTVWRKRGDYVGARFGAKFTRLWQNTAIPTAAAKLLNPRYMQIESRNARFKTEIDPSIPARK